ncbi:hypothetical protein [Pseudomonas sp. lyk4-40-TSB-59a]|uniref:hypothetical protein n=1 Tax=Pseudomonas sp. lyk4-40-TSB-59a TaxID=3040314 RepID=UPI00255760BD|nr:hypothetical protein [Pseudomonas sp. lyk4-40-TSB-59a]MDF9903942.1 hypothetical protein [Pseudomonas reinekei]
MSTDGRIHIGTWGMGIPKIYSEVVTKIVSGHLALESALCKQIKSRSLKPSRKQFAARLAVVVSDLGLPEEDWSIDACRKLNKVRNDCAHIGDGDYQFLAARIMEPAEEFVGYVKQHNTRLAAHKISDFDWACTMTYQRIYEICGLEYDPLIFGKHASLPTEIRNIFLSPSA